MARLGVCLAGYGEVKPACACRGGEQEARLTYLVNYMGLGYLLLSHSLQLYLFIHSEVPPLQSLGQTSKTADCRTILPHSITNNK